MGLKTLSYNFQKVDLFPKFQPALIYLGQGKDWKKMEKEVIGALKE